MMLLDGVAVPIAQSKAAPAILACFLFLQIVLLGACFQTLQPQMLELAGREAGRSGGADPRAIDVVER